MPYREGGCSSHLPESSRTLDDDALFLASLLVLSAHVQDAVRVDVERDLDLRHTPASRHHKIRGAIENKHVVKA